MTKKPHTFRTFTIISAILGLLLMATPTYAISILPTCATTGQTTKAADLNCVLETFENIAEIILGVTGSFALLMFVYGGFTLMSSGGSEEKVTKGKTIIRNAVIGILIIMLSGYLIRYAVNTLRGDGSLQGAGASCSEEIEGGRYYNVGGQQICAKNCDDVGYTCTTNTAGKNCLIGLCEGDQNTRCCPNN